MFQRAGTWFSLYNQQLSHFHVPENVPFKIKDLAFWAFWEINSYRGLSNASD
jgi:hypothetical protein